jgi:cytochrome o ubiquinol oxidase subunit 2
MINKRLTQLLILVVACFLASTTWAFHFGVLDPKGWVAHQERELMFDTLALMLIVVVPVIIMSFAFAYRFRTKKRRGAYHPEWSHNAMLELCWWGIPSVIIVVLGIFVWKSTHRLDPYRDLQVKGKKELVQAVALQWKWLFIYPKEGVASLNDLYLPVNQQVEFHITADAPMSAFDIPQLGGQIYAMAGMRTRLHLISSHPGTYEGLNTQLNGDGFADMHFKAHVVSQQQFQQWIAGLKQINKPLTLDKYKALYKPEMAAPAQYFSSVPPHLFMQIMMQYMTNKHWLHPQT